MRYRTPVLPGYIYQYLDDRIVGQDIPKQKLATLGYFYTTRQYLLATDLTKTVRDFPSLNMMLIGPTGTGKTEMCHLLAEYLKVPYLRIDVSCISMPGYKGIDLSEYLSMFLEELNVALVPGVLVLDEFDKLGQKPDSSAGDSTTYQASFLDLLEGKYSQRKFNSGIYSDENLARLNQSLILLAGSFNECLPSKHIKEAKDDTVYLDIPVKEITKHKVEDDLLGEKRSIGFHASNTDEQDNDYLDIRELMKKAGILPEIIGRIVDVCITRKLNRAQIKQLLTSTKNSVYYKYKELFPYLELNEADIDELAKKLTGNKYGIRALNGEIFEIYKKKIAATMDIKTVPVNPLSTYDLTDGERHKLDIDRELFKDWVDTLEDGINEYGDEYDWDKGGF